MIDRPNRPAAASDLEVPPDAEAPGAAPHWVRCLGRRRDHALALFEGRSMERGYLPALCGIPVYPLGAARPDGRRCRYCAVLMAARAGGSNT